MRASETPLQLRFGEGVVEGFHFTAAGAFILLLVPITYLFGREEGKRQVRPGRMSSRFWRNFHWTCSGLIVVAFALAAFAGITGGPDKGLLIAEWAAIWAFGAFHQPRGAERDLLLGRT